MTHLRVENKLLDADFAQLLEVFSDGSVDSVQLLPAIDCGFVRILPLFFFSRFGLSISTETFSFSKLIPPAFLERGPLCKQIFEAQSLADVARKLLRCFASGKLF